MGSPIVDTPAARRSHWVEYAAEAVGLGLFMVSACAFATLLWLPASRVAGSVTNEWARRAGMGLAMGATAVGLIYSPWGKRSGAHLNPAVTLAFYRLGKIAPRDAALYVAAQAVGGLAGVALSAAVLRGALSHPAVNYVATVPGGAGPAVAWFVEFGMAAGMMLLVLAVSNSRRWAGYTGLCAGGLVAVYIALFAPLSGMSMNPARSLASAVPSGAWSGLWIYFTAPPLAMLAAAQAFVFLRGSATVRCAKLHHAAGVRCIFCEHQAAPRGTVDPKFTAPA